MPYRKSYLWGNCKPPVGSTIDWGDPINANLVGYWPFNEGCGAVVSDIAGRNNGTLSAAAPWSPVPNSHVFGTAPLGNGSTMWANVGDLPPFRLTGAMTLAAWCRAGTSGGTTCLMGKLGASGSRGYSFGYNTTTPTFFIASNSTTLITTTGGTHNGTDVFFYAAVYLPSTYCALYQNGVQIAFNTTSIPASQFSANSVPFRIGERGDGTQATLGRFWNARIYGRALTQAEIQRLFFEQYAGVVAPRRRIISAIGTTPTFNAGWATGATSTVLGGIR